MRKVISLYTGIGGLDFGFEAAGFETAVAVEVDATACRTIRLNRPWPVLEGDIHDFLADGCRPILKLARLAPGEADVLIGGPPCQPFSKSGYWARFDAQRLEDPRASTLDAYLAVLRDAQPKTFLLENVYGLVYKGKDEGFRHIQRGIERINCETGARYQVSLALLNARDFGVPQIRERVFLVGSRSGEPFNFPSPASDILIALLVAAELRKPVVQARLRKAGETALRVLVPEASMRQNDLVKPGKG